MSYSLEEFEISQESKKESNLSLPLRGIVTNVLPEKELYKIDSFGTGGNPHYAISHPFLGVNSWIRAVGEPGTAVLIQQRGDINQQEIWGYISNKVEGVIKQALIDKVVAYRVLQPGEVEVMSSGKASAFFSSNGDLELKGGAVSQELSSSEAEINSVAPSHRRAWFLNQPNTLGHEERVGVVKRPNVQWPNTKNEPVRFADTTFAVERSYWLNNQNDEPLTEHQEGHVINPTGTTIKQSSTNKDTRYRTVVHGTNNGTLTLEVDQELNTVITNASATKETRVDFGAKSEITWKAKKWTVQVTDVGKLQFTRALDITSNKIKVTSPNVTFGATGSQPVILGTVFTSSVMTPLLTLLLAAFSAMADAPSGGILPVLKAASKALQTGLPPIQAALPSTLSKVVKLST